MEFTLLTKDQIFGNKALDVIKKYGRKVAPTDLAVLLGGLMTYCDNRTSEGDLACSSCSADGDLGVVCVNPNGEEYSSFSSGRIVSARPVLSPSEASKISLSNARSGVNGVKIVEYGGTHKLLRMNSSVRGWKNYIKSDPFVRQENITHLIQLV